LSYRFTDLNLDTEDTNQTIIRWYINGIEAEYLRGLREWNDIENQTDPLWVYGFSFLPGDVPIGISVEEYARDKKESLIKVGDVIHFTVKPNDGKTFGIVVKSSSTKVIASPPFVTRLVIKGRTNTGVVQDVVTTSTAAFAEYNVFDDGGDGSSTIVWFVNGFEFKKGLLGGTTNGFKNDELIFGEVLVGTATRAITIGNDLEVEIRPAAGNTIGNSVRSEIKTVENSPPVVSSVTITPTDPVPGSNLQLVYTFGDTDITDGSVLQSDQSSIRWYRKRSADSVFEEVVSVANKSLVPNVLLAINDQWYAEVIPFDGISVGETVRSNTVQVK
jgi:hypothetical protein